MKGKLTLAFVAGVVAAVALVAAFFTVQLPASSARPHPAGRPDYN